jgi:hypothetical protein
MRRIQTVFLAAAVSVAALSGCATSGTTPASTTSRNSNVITKAELSQIQVRTARQAIEQLRPNWLRNRGISNANGADGVKVYMDVNAMGGAEALDQMSVAEIQEIRYLSPAEATNRFGAGHQAGAIVVVVGGR